MTTDQPVILPKKSKLHPLLEILPLHLKDPKNYFRIKKEILDTVLTNCGHDSITKMAECKKCSENMMKRRLLLKRLGFKNPQQYHMWQKIMDEIIRLYPEMGFDNDKKYIKL